MPHAAFNLAAALLLLIAQAVPTTPGPTDNRPVEPFRIADQVSYVGASDIASYLITTPAGHILIDAGYAETVPLIEANVRKLGHRMEDIRILLNTQAHFDHAAGLARMKTITGAQLMVSDADAAVVEAGGRGDFYFGDRAQFAPAKVDRRLKDGEQVRLGTTVLTARVTAGHTKGTTTWTFDATDRGRTYHVVVLGGLTILDGTRVSGMPSYPEIARDYARTFDMLRQLPCDIFLGAHMGYFNGTAKAARAKADPGGPNPFVDPAGFRAFVSRAEERFRQQLAREKQ
jgi:metallo-beta-lactamase class B